MRLATVLTPINDENLALAAQCGVTDLVARYPGPDRANLERTQRHAERFGLRVRVVEGHLPIERLKIGADDDRKELLAMRMLLRQMADSDIQLLCYNFMAGTDWVRTRSDFPERGGAVVTSFRLKDVQQAVSLSSTAPLHQNLSLSAEALWRNLERFLHELLPTAEQCGVTMCMHPDDPPLREIFGRARIMNSIEAFEQLVQLAPSPSNKLCFCQGTFAATGVDIPAAIRRLGPHIRYVHFRDVRGTADDFDETFHDNGPTDMAAAIRAYREIGFNGPIRPDHVPQFVGEVGEPGYTMLGRLFAYGYIRGLMHATEPSR